MRGSELSSSLVQLSVDLQYRVQTDCGDCVLVAVLILFITSISIYGFFEIVIYILSEFVSQNEVSITYYTIVTRFYRNIF